MGTSPHSTGVHPENERLSSRGRGSLPGSRKSDERSPRVGGFKALDSQIDGEANTVLGAVKSPSGSRCFE